MEDKTLVWSLWAIAIWPIDTTTLSLNKVGIGDKFKRESFLNEWLGLEEFWSSQASIKGIISIEELMKKLSSIMIGILWVEPTTHRIDILEVEIGGIIVEFTFYWEETTSIHSLKVRKDVTFSESLLAACSWLLYGNQLS